MGRIRQKPLFKDVKMTEVRKFRAFTLVELLVVISIIAILLAVLIPAMNKAREIAKITMCAANSKQISLVVELCRAENDGAVPTMLNRFTTGGAPPPYPARSRLLSVALCNYTPETKDLASKDIGEFDPDKDWGSSNDTRTKPDYFTKYLPKFYSCPFVRNGPVQEFQTAPAVTFPGCKTPVLSFKRVGSGESYSVWRWELQCNVRPDNYPGSDLYSLLGAPQGTPQYGTLPWNNSADLQNTSNWTTLDNSPVKWSSKQLKRIAAAGMAQATILYCEQGQTDSHTGGPIVGNGVYNYGSHKKSGTGGTNVVFGDSHVGWVTGTRVGWP